MKLFKLTVGVLLLLPCTSTSTAKLVKCVVSHFTLLPSVMVDTPSSDQEFLDRKLPFNTYDLNVTFTLPFWLPKNTFKWFYKVCKLLDMP